MIEGVAELFKRVRVIDEKPIRFLSEPEEFIGLISYLKERGFGQLTLYTAVDWIEEGNFELVAILYNIDSREEVYVKTYISREAPRIETIKDLYPQAATYEKELHEFFGIEFIGNDDMGEFILENWQYMPPLRKDFDTVDFVQKVYGVKDEEVQGRYKNKQIKYRGFKYNERG